MNETDQRPRPAQDHDARRPPSSSAAFSCTSCRAASTASDITASSPARFALTTSSAPGNCSPRQRMRPSVRAPRPTVEAEDVLACAPLPVLRRPDDHRRDVRRPAPCAIAVAEPDQDRHLMTVATHPASHRRSLSPPAARRNTNAMSARCPQSSSDRCEPATTPRISPTENARRRRLARRTWLPTATHATKTNALQASNPHSSRPPNQPPTSPRFPPWEAFKRRPPPRPTVAKGRRPKPLRLSARSRKRRLGFDPKPGPPDRFRPGRSATE